MTCAREANTTAAALYVALGRLVRDLRRAGGSSPIGPSAMGTMVTLNKSDTGLRLGALAEAEGISAPSMTRVIHSLEELGLVARTPDPDDGRCQLVELTRDGRSLIVSGTETKMRSLRERIDALTPEQRRLLDDALPALEALSGASVPV